MIKHINIKYKYEKIKIILIGVLLLLLLLVSFSLLSKAFASYQSSATLNAHINKAYYIFGNQKLSFNIDSNKIIPSNTPYVYKFSISNFNASYQSDVDIEYNMEVRSTTNLPITISLYRNQNYDDSGAVNLLSSSSNVQDTDGAWYRVFAPSDTFYMFYGNRTTDVYSLVVDFPKVYAQDMTYADSIENISITVKSKESI